ncbi:hypothetical protein DPMN_161105 [Dreissena polymorpha]|uniref:NACHT domain-containing protein n=1 Tax=Dreissena polymorpha TaxID=45954 RepID=A0A9D4ERJ4_DREPO|nr:hypothetical protein DPMN_161105 [Dreissena polymorpha]
MLPIDGKTSSVNSNTQMRDSNVFDDLTCLNGFKFVFHVQLRESVDQFDIAKIIKKQIVDSIYSSEEDRGKAYILLNEIMKRERCLVLLDGLDEWIGTGEPREIGTRHNLPKLADVHSHCVLLITTRPWKMTGAKILDSQIDKLLQLDGVKNVFEASRKILGCRKDCKKRQDLDKKQSEFELYVQKYGLLEPLHFPMMLCLIVQLWAEGTELKGSKCEMYSFLLDSLFKKATSEPSEFQEPTYRCFTETQYIQPNIEHLNRLAEAAFDLLFSDTQNKALVFTTKELKKYNLGELDQNNVALKSGILSTKRQEPTLRALPSFSFIHKSIQEFLAAYHIARITHLNLIDDVISGYLDRHEDAYLDVSQVFIFLCGLDIMSANKLSGMMDERNNACVKSRCVKSCFDTIKLCEIILQGYREAVANEQTNIALTLSHMFYWRDNIRELDSLKNDVRDLHSVWKNNTRNLLSLDLRIDNLIDFNRLFAFRGGSPAIAEPTSHIEFDMSSCHRLEYLDLGGNGIWLKDSDSAARSEQPVWIVLESSNPVLSSIKHISLGHIKCSSTWLNSLFSTLLTLDHEVQVGLDQCDISSRIEGAFNRMIDASIATDVNKCLNLTNLDYCEVLDAQVVELLFKSVQLETLNIQLNARNDIDPSLWDALNSLTINRVTLSLDNVLNSVWYGPIVNNVSMLSQALLSNNTETIFIYLNAQPYLMDAMHGLPIISLSLFGSGEGLDINHVASLQKLLFSLKQLEKISLLQSNESPGLWEALHNLNIKSLSLNYRDVHNLSSFAQFLASLTHLETLNIRVEYGSHLGLCDALHGLNIKSLSLNDSMGNGQLTFTKPWSRLFQSLTQLETLSIGITDWSKVEASAFFQAFHGLNIKSLSLNGYMFFGLEECTSWHCSQLFQSLIQLETLSMRVSRRNFNLWDLETLSMRVSRNFNLWDSLRGLHITRLSLSGVQESLKVNNAELLSQSISSLTLLETLTLHVFAYIDLQLPQSLKYFNFYCTGISPPELRDLVKALSACTQTVESKLEFGCARCIYKDNRSRTTLFPPEEYIPVQLELTVQRNITVKRFRILDRIRADRWYESADSAWSVRDNVAVENDDYDDGIVDDDTYDLFVRHLDSDFKFLDIRIKNRISMRVQSHAASNS